MRCDWRNDPNAPGPCHVVDLDTGKVIPACSFANDETGEYTCYVLPLKFNRTTGQVATRSGVGNIEIRLGNPP